MVERLKRFTTKSLFNGPKAKIIVGAVAITIAVGAAATITIMCVLYLDQKVGFLLFCLLIKHLLCLDIPRRPSCADPLHRTGLDHGTEDGFNGRGADIGEYFANLGFG